MITIIGWFIGLFVLSIFLRVLRRNFRFIDWIAYLLMLGVFIGVWISENFWWGLVAGFIALIVVSLMTGIGNKTEIKRFGRKYSFECENCGLGDLDIIQDLEEAITVKCPRCGKVVSYILNH